MQGDKILKAVFAFLGGAAGFLWGKLDGLLLAMIGFMVIDFVTGLIVGGVNKNLNSEVCFRGLAKKMLILSVVAVAHILDTQIFQGSTSVCRSAVIGFYCANEGMSILENAGKLGMPLPGRLKQMLEQLRDKESEKDEDSSNRRDDV